MLVRFETALALLLVVGLPPLLAADAQRSSNEPLSAKEVRTAEAQARTAADHLRLVEWYQSQAFQTQIQLKEAEDQVKYWERQPGMVVLTKIPNPYWNARAWVRIYREKLQKVTKRAAWHQMMADSLQSSGKSTP
jgi:hypothetical protein